MILYDMLVMHNKNLGTKGDCLRACIATLLQIPPEGMPHFVNDPEYPNWVYGLNIWLARHDLAFMMVPNSGLYLTHSGADIYHLIIGPSPREGSHAVVGLNGKMFHDPHPSRAGVVSESIYGSDLKIGFLVKRFASKP